MRDLPVRHQKLPSLERKLNCILEHVVSRRVHKTDIMSKSSCEVLAQSFFSFSEIEDFYSASIANCVFNSFLSYTAIMLNIVTIHAIRKTLSLPRTLKTLLLSLAVSDVGVGLLVQPFYISLLIKWVQESNIGCSTYKTFQIIMYLFSTASFCGVVAISVDRFLAIHLHLRYQELVTHKRVVAVVIPIWLLSAFSSSMALWVPSNNRSLVLSIPTGICLLVTTVVYIKIYLAVRRHKNQIQALQVQNPNFASLIKSAVSTFWVYLVFLVCYLPMLICLAVVGIYGPNITLNRTLHFSYTLMLLNSSLNPVIYCWKMRHIRQAIMTILRNMSWQKKCLSR